MNCSSKDKRLVFARALEELWIQISGNKLSEAFLSPLLPLDPPHNFFTPLNSSSSPDSLPSSTERFNLNDENSRSSTPPQASVPVCSAGGREDYVDLYSIALKIRHLSYDTNLDSFLEDIELLSLLVHKILESYRPRHAPSPAATAAPPDSVSGSVTEEEDVTSKGYKETILQSLSTILFPIRNLSAEKRQKLTNDLADPLTSSSASSLEGKLLQIWRRESSLSLTHLRELYLSKDYFQTQVHQNDSDTRPLIIPRSLASWSNFLNSSCGTQQQQQSSNSSSSPRDSQWNLMVIPSLSPLPSLCLPR
jgi:hypothetical protein